MDTDSCWLCLDTNTPKVSFHGDNLKLLDVFIQDLNFYISRVHAICEICINILKDIEKLIESISETEEGIENFKTKYNMEKVDLGLIQNSAKNLKTCRVCLAIVRYPQVFLCENDTNILRYDLIKSMLQFCNIQLNLENSVNPIMCIKCWELVLTAYCFKKNYIEVKKKINFYCTWFNIKGSEINSETLQKVKAYFSNLEKSLNREENPKEYIIDKNISPNIFVELDHAYANRIPDLDDCADYSSALKDEAVTSGTDLCKEKPPTLPVELGNESEKTPKVKSGSLESRRRYFKRADDLALISLYLEKTENGRTFPKKYWDEISFLWNKMHPHLPRNKYVLAKRVNNIFCKNMFSVELDKVKAKVSRNLQLQKYLSPTLTDPLSDSDDSFVDEVAPSSFTPNLKVEHLSSSDSEIDIINVPNNSKMEIESDCESLHPQLDRMDIITSENVNDMSSLEIKRGCLSPIMRAHKKGPRLFKCSECCFRTKSIGSSKRHIMWHQKDPAKKLHVCPYCPYRISSKISLDQHIKIHEDGNENEDFPVLVASV